MKTKNRMQSKAFLIASSSLLTFSFCMTAVAGGAGWDPTETNNWYALWRKGNRCTNSVPTPLNQFARVTLQTTPPSGGPCSYTIEHWCGIAMKGAYTVDTNRILSSCVPWVNGQDPQATQDTITPAFDPYTIFQQYDLDSRQRSKKILRKGNFFCSASGKFKAVNQNDGNFCIYQAGYSDPIWCDNAISRGGSNPGINNTVVLQPDGNLVHYSNCNDQGLSCTGYLWGAQENSSMPIAQGNYMLQLDDDGSLVREKGDANGSFSSSVTYFNIVPASTRPISSTASFGTESVGGRCIRFP